MVQAHLPHELGVITLATPCHVDWESMHGDDRVRFCGQCNLNVYDVENLTSFEVRDLLVKHEGKACMRLYARADGTVITKDCPVGLALVGRLWRSEKKRARLHFRHPVLVAGAAALAVAAAGITVFGDEIRRVFGTSSCDLIAPDPARPAQPSLTNKTMGGFKFQENRYR